MCLLCETEEVGLCSWVKLFFSNYEYYTKEMKINFQICLNLFKDIKIQFKKNFNI